ncbi:exported hypothetical protein [Verrucomicrobia bacterium]|nr:exported hypothetical protein [Verrucomicrobiota bacterium]
MRSTACSARISASSTGTSASPAGQRVLEERASGDQALALRSEKPRQVQELHGSAAFAEPKAYLIRPRRGAVLVNVGGVRVKMHVAAD